MSMWLEIATLHAQECQKSQALNAELRDAVGKQTRLANALKAILSKKSSQFGLHLLREDRRTYLYNNVLQPQEPHAVADLRRRVEHLYLDLEATFSHDSWTKMLNSVVCTSQLKLDPITGPTNELRMSAPLQGGFMDAGKLLWRCIMASEVVVQTPQYYMKRQLLTHSSLLKSFVIQLDGPAGHIELQGVTYVQRFSNSARDAYIWGSVILSSHDSEVFREKDYVMASSSAADGSSTNSQALLRGFYKVASDARDNETCVQPKRRQREFVLKTLGNRIRHFQQFMQSLLLDEFAGGSMSKAPLFLSDAATCQNWFQKSPRDTFVQHFSASCRILQQSSIIIKLEAVASMSFLMDEDDAQATLQVALAFIDAHDVDAYTSTSDSSSPLSPSSGSSGSPPGTTTNSDACSSSPPQQQQQTAATLKQAAERPKGNAEAVRRLRVKKKAEAVQLREQVAQLETQLQQLQRAHKSGSSLQVFLQRLRRSEYTGLRTENNKDSNDDAGGDEEGIELLATTQPQNNNNPSPWLEIAAMQAQERVKSQALNAELKDAVSRQVKLVESIEAMLGKKASQYGLDLLRDEQRQFLQRNTALSNESGILAELRHRVQLMHLRLESVFNLQFWVEIADATVCSIRLQQDPVSGPIVELRMNVPLPCDFREAGEVVWRRTINMSSLIETPKYSMQRQQLTPNSFQKCFTIKLDAAPGGTALELRGTAYAQRFLIDDRFAYIWVSAIALNKGETYREQGWAVANNASTTSSEPQTLYRVYFQVACDSHGDAPSAESKARREFVLKTLGNRTRAYHQFTQNMLLDAFSGFQSQQPLQLPGSEMC